MKNDTEWVGFCVMVDIRSVPASMAERETVDHWAGATNWFMAAVYVDRSVHGTGARKKMIQFGIDTIREQSRKTGTDNAICVTNVVHGNTTALELYNRLGFQVTDEDEVEEKEGRTYHTTQLKMQL